MQAIAPGSRGALQAGHSLVGAEGVAAGGGGGDGRAGTDTDGDDGRAGAPAATGSRAGAAMRNARWHFGQRTCLPTASSGTRIGVPQVAFGQRISWGIVSSVISDQSSVDPSTEPCAPRTDHCFRFCLSPNRMMLSPTRIVSPERNGVGWAIRLPFRRVPACEPPSASR